MIVETANGVLLNNILPPGTRIIRSEFNEASIKDGNILIPKEFERMGLLGKVNLAHESGHILSPDDVALVKKEKEAEVTELQSLDDAGKIDVLLIERNAKMEAEIEAWQYGKTVADVLNVDEIMYEDLMQFALENYYMKSLEILATTVDLENVTPKDKVIRILEPRSQEYLTMSLGELNAYITNMYETNRIISIDRKFKRSAIAASKKE